MAAAGQIFLFLGTWMVYAGTGVGRSRWPDPWAFRELIQVSSMEVVGQMGV